MVLCSPQHDLVAKDLVFLGNPVHCEQRPGVSSAALLIFVQTKQKQLLGLSAALPLSRQLLRT